MPKIVFGLAFDVERSNATRSGFKPALIDMGGGHELFGRERLEGLASMMRLNYAHELILVGGMEGRYKADAEPVARASAIMRMLEMDFGIEASRMQAFVSRSNTGGNVQIIADCVRENSLAFGDFEVVTSHYHVPRADEDLKNAGIFCHVRSAESFILLASPERKSDIAQAFGGNAFADRVMEEIQGRAHKLAGTYKPKTDAPAVEFHPHTAKT